MTTLPHDDGADRRFPILLPWNETKHLDGLTDVPWSLVAPHADQARKNHYQTLERLAARGGLTLSELVAVLEGRRWEKMERADALALVRLSLTEHTAGAT